MLSETQRPVPPTGEEPRPAILRSICEAGGPSIAVGPDSPMLGVLRDLEMLSATEAPAVFWGEPGTGRRTLALAVHALSRRRAQTLLRVRAVAQQEPRAPAFSVETLPADGPARVMSAEGLAELIADGPGGTLLLEGLSDLPALAQEQLIVLLDRFHSVGADQSHQIPRVLAVATDPPLALVEDGELSEELYYRLGVFVIGVPPLRERPTDVLAVAQHVVARANALHRLTVHGLDEPTAECLRGAPWPGNIPELRRAVEHAAIRARSGWIRPHHLPGEVKGPNSASPPARLVIPIGITAADAERRLILATLEQTGFNKTEAARRLGMDVKTVRTKLKSYDLSERARRRRDRSSSPGQAH